MDGIIESYPSELSEDEDEDEDEDEEEGIENEEME
jgi:hypothetical protein